MPVYRSKVVSAPGPAIRGIASGKIEMSSPFSSSASSCSRTVALRIPEGRAKTISRESRKSRAPPAILNAGTPMPNALNNPCPPNAKKSRIAAPTAVPLIAALRLYASVPPRVRVTNNGAIPRGSNTTNSVTKALDASSSTALIMGR